MNGLNKIIIYCTLLSLLFLENKIISAAGIPIPSIGDFLRQAGLDEQACTDFEKICLHGESSKVKRKLFYKQNGAQLLKPNGTELLLAVIGSISPGASKKHYEKTIKALLQAKAAINTATPTTQQTPLMIAAEHNRQDLAKLFLRNFADWSFKDATGNTAAQLATDQGYSIDKIQSDYGVDPKSLN